MHRPLSVSWRFGRRPRIDKRTGQPHQVNRLRRAQRVWQNEKGRVGVIGVGQEGGDHLMSKAINS